MLSNLVLLFCIFNQTGFHFSVFVSVFDVRCRLSRGIDRSCVASHQNYAPPMPIKSDFDGILFIFLCCFSSLIYNIVFFFWVAILHTAFNIIDFALYLV